MLDFTGKAAAVRLLGNRFAVVEPVKGWKYFFFCSPGPEMAYVEFVKPVWRYLSGQHRVVVAAWRLKQQESPGVENPLDFPVAREGRLKMFCNETVKNKVERPILERQLIRLA